LKDEKSQEKGAANFAQHRFMGLIMLGNMLAI